jgi:hypothetical protein
VGVVEVGERADVLARVDDDFLPVERRIEIRDDPDLPGLPEPERLRGRPIFPAAAEGTALELLVRCRLELREPGAGAVPASGREDDPPAAERIDAEVGQLRPESPLDSMTARKSSIGSGRTRVELRSEVISSMVCRKRS